MNVYWKCKRTSIFFMVELECLVRFKCSFCNGVFNVYVLSIKEKRSTENRLFLLTISQPGFTTPRFTWNCQILLRKLGRKKVLNTQKTKHRALRFPPIKWKWSGIFILARLYRNSRRKCCRKFNKFCLFQGDRKILTNILQW